MHKLILAVALLSTGAFAQTDLLGTVRKSSGQQATTSAAPTLVTQGMPLKDVSTVQLLVCAPLTVWHEDGGTGLDVFLADGGLGGAGDGGTVRQYLDGGTMFAWYYDNTRAEFSPKPEWDETLATSNTSGCQQFASRAVGVSSGRLYYQASGVIHLNPDAGSGDDGGPGLLVQLKGWTGGTPGRGEKVEVSGAVSVSGTVSATGSTIASTGPDGGPVSSRTVGGRWDCDYRPEPGTCSATDGGSAYLQFTAGAYLKGRCVTAAYAGGAKTMESDGGNAPTCESADGGVYPICDFREAQKAFYLDHTDFPDRNAVGCKGYGTGTGVCLFWECRQ